MQTFMPYSSFVRSAKCLDDKRLGKQRVEAYQILRTLLGETAGWANHPAVRMWSGYERSLLAYGSIVCMVWRSRDFRDTVLDRLCELAPLSALDDLPPWLGDERLHASHRSNLLRKDPEWYGQYGWKESPDLPYFWPTKDMDHG